MRVMSRVVVALASFVILPATAFSQACCAGIVRDTSGAVLPGVTWRAASPALHRKGPHRRHRRHRPVPASRSDARHLHADLHAVRLRHGQARGHRGDRRRASRRSTPTCASERSSETITVTGETPVVDVQTSTRRQVVLDERGDRRRFRRRAATATCSRWCPGIQATGARRQLQASTHELLHRARRTRQRRHGADRRHERRVGVQRRRRRRASPTIGERAGGPGDRRGRPRRERPRRAGVQHHSEDRRQHVQRHRLLQPAPASGRRATTSTTSCAASASPRCRR